MFFFFRQSCVLIQVVTGDCQDRTSWSYVFGCQLNLTYMRLPGISLFPEGIGSILWSCEFSNQLFDRWPKEMSDFYWFNFGILTYTDKWIYIYIYNVLFNMYIYIYVFITHIHNSDIQIICIYPCNMKCFVGKFVHQTTINSSGWGLSALDKRRPCIRKWPRLWLGKDRKVMRFVTSVENRYLQMMHQYMEQVEMTISRMIIYKS